ncbi:MAG: TonB-dependent receptor [Chitinophagales bacterium]
MKRSILLYFIALTCIAQAQDHIEGFVYVTGTEIPVPYAGVFNNGELIAVTDSAGTFSVDHLVSSNYTISHIAFESKPAKVIIYAMQEDVEKVVLYVNHSNTMFNEVVVISGRTKNRQPVPITNISGEALRSKNTGKDMPFILESTPSAVVTSDAGNGIGYTGLRIRGSDATRVSVTINGVPYNDAESQQTYWVDLPDIASSAFDIQIQRGAGTSTYGVSSLGAAVNIYTNNLKEQASADYTITAGSFGTLRNTFTVNSGKLGGHWYVSARGSVLHSDGYIDRAYADLQSAFIKAAYTSNKYTSIVDIFPGKEKTYQAWGGVPVEILDTDRTYNPYTYANQTDNYTQAHYQWHQYLDISKKDHLQLTLNYSKGSGYYEQLEEQQALADYGVQPAVHGADTTFFTDMITQKWLENDFTGAFVQYTHYHSAWTLQSGGAYYTYGGDHYGKVIWAEDASTLGYDHTYYTNNAQKGDANAFVQMTYYAKLFLLFADMQVRNVQYRYTGANYDGSALEDTAMLWFANPKLGVTWLQSNNADAYLYIGMSGKEPNRDDFVASSPDSRPKPEILYDLELGERLRMKGWEFMGNIYYMYYRDQLVLTGALNDVGAYIRTNVPESYRTGVEVSLNKLFFNQLQWSANAAFSVNRIPAHTEYVDNWDDGNQVAIVYSSSPIAFSPDVIAYDKLEYVFNTKTWDHIHPSIALESKFVGRQYVDNTGDKNRSLDPYLYHNLRLGAVMEKRDEKKYSLYLDIFNLTNTLYESNAWVYRYISGGSESMLLGLYPQAGIHWSATLRVEI